MKAKKNCKKSGCKYFKYRLELLFLLYKINQKEKQEL